MARLEPDPRRAAQRPRCLSAVGLVLATALGALGSAGPARAEPRPAGRSSAQASPSGAPSTDAPPRPLPAPSEPAASGAALPAPTPGSSAGSTPVVPAASPSAAPAGAAAVRVHERVVFSLRVARAGQAAADRARAASQALASAVESGDDLVVRVEEADDLASIYAGMTPIVTLSAADAEAEAEPSVHLYAATVAARVGEAVRSERKRNAIASGVFSVSLLVFSGLIAYLLLRRVRDLAHKAAAWIEDHPEGLPGLRLGGIEVVEAVAVRGALTLALSVGRLLAQLGLVYAWLIIAFSFFDATRGYDDRLTGFVLKPVSALVGRAGSALPLLVVAGVAALAVGILVRFVRLSLGSVARGETRLEWLPPDLAAPTSVLVRAAIIVLGLVFAAPLITGADDGALSRAGAIALLALGLSATPLLACAAAGIPVVFGRRLRLGDLAEVGGHAGRVRRLSLLEVGLEDASGCEVRVPHLLGLLRPTRVIGRGALEALDLHLDPRADQAHVRALLVAAAQAVCSAVTVELLSLDRDGAHYRVAGQLHTPSAPTATHAHRGSRPTFPAGLPVAPPPAQPPGSLAGALTAALARDGVALGRGRGGAESA